MPHSQTISYGLTTIEEVITVIKLDLHLSNGAADAANALIHTVVL